MAQRKRWLAAGAALAVAATATLGSTPASAAPWPMVVLCDGRRALLACLCPDDREGVARGGGVIEPVDVRWIRWEPPMQWC